MKKTDEYAQRSLRAQELNLQGLTLRQIGQQLGGISKQRVSQLLKELGHPVKHNGRRPPLTEEQVERANALRQVHGLTVPEAARVLDVPRYVVVGQTRGAPAARSRRFRHDEVLELRRKGIGMNTHDIIALAEEHGVTYPSMFNIIKGKSYTWVR